MSKYSKGRSAPFPHPAALWLLAAAACLTSCGSGDSGGVEVVVPRVISLNTNVLSPGDTLSITGENFATPASNNRVNFNNALANPAPFFATAESLAVRVPEYANSGPLRVYSKGVASNSVEIEIVRGLGDVWVMGGSKNYSFKVPAPAGSTEYLIIPHSATSASAVFAYTMTPETTSTYPSPLGGATGVSSGTASLPITFEQDIRRQAIEYLESHGPRVRPAARSAPADTCPSTMSFFVLNCTKCSTTNPASFTKVTATLRYKGLHACVYSDTNQPPGSFLEADYDAFGAQFDAAIFPIDTTYFGRETDVNQDGHVVILFSPAVNKLTPPGTAAKDGYIAGFFLFNDLVKNIFPAGTSNGMEIFYVMVPDPTGVHGNVFTKTQVTADVPSTLAHEFEHMISFGYRFFVAGGGTSGSFFQSTWLEEGMAHIAEDLNAMNSQNVARSNRYLRDPGGTSIMGDDTIEQRGAIYLFLRYLGDQLGNEIFRTILQSNCVGMKCVEDVTGKNFFVPFADYLATLYLNGRGITPDPRYSYTSIVIPPESLKVTTRVVSAGPVNDAVRNAAGDFFVITNPQPPAIRFGLSAAATAANLRTVVVRIK